jgi:hypothetical protein
MQGDPRRAESLPAAKWERLKSVALSPVCATSEGIGWPTNVIGFPYPATRAVWCVSAMIVLMRSPMPPPPSRAPSRFAWHSHFIIPLMDGIARETIRAATHRAISLQSFLG